MSSIFKKDIAEVNQNKEVSFEDAELIIEKPSLDKKTGNLVITGNFTELGNSIASLVAKYKDTQLTDENFQYVKTLKSHFVSLRTRIEKERKDYKKAYITPADKLVDSMCAELQRIVAEGEDALGKQLAEYDQRRKDELTLILNDYVADSVKKFGLRAEYASKIMLLDKYYNLTQKEEDSIADIERQAETLKKEQTEYDSSCALIKDECSSSGLVAETYIRELAYKSASEILLEIRSDAKIHQEMVKKQEAGEKIEVGSPLTDELKKALSLDEEEDKASLKTVAVKLTYKAELSSVIAQFFKDNGIIVEKIR